MICFHLQNSPLNVSFKSFQFGSDTIYNLPNTLPPFCLCFCLKPNLALKNVSTTPPVLFISCLHPLWTSDMIYVNICCMLWSEDLGCWISGKLPLGCATGSSSVPRIPFGSWTPSTTHRATCHGSCVAVAEGRSTRSCFDEGMGGCWNWMGELCSSLM